MNRNAHRARLIGLTVATALASTALAGCTTANGPRANASANSAETALAKGKVDKAVELAEKAVAGDPNNAAYRAVLGAAYLKAGRFESSATTYDDAMALGDTSPRTALSLALAQIAAGHQHAAVAVLDDWRDQIAPADLGLAYALAGEAERGVRVLSDTLRAGENTPKVRQNLAYAYALAGMWREARLMAAQDVPADQLGDRMSQWAMSMRPDAYKQRIAGLLDVPANEVDPGRPAALALNATPAAQQLAAEASELENPAPAANPVTAEQPYRTAAANELPALAQDAPAPAAPQQPKPELALARYAAPRVAEPSSFEAAFATEAPKGSTPAAVIADTVRFVTQPVVQKLPARYGIAPAPSQAPGLGGASGGDHLVQLGSFFSEQGARRAWGIYAKRLPGLDEHQMEISRAVVNGKKYWRVSAAGFDKSAARTMCAKAKAQGQGCIPYPEGNPLPGAIR